MLSPFPGMDPFLEVHWGDVQTRLARSFAVNLRKQLPGGLVARVEESVVLGIDDDDLPPAEIATQLVPRTQRSVHIYDAMMKMKLITAIELIGPANKVGVKNREAYRSRASKALEAGASLVEVDLIRQGESVLCRPPTDPDGHYSICIVRPWDIQKGDVVAARFDEPLPTIQVSPSKEKPPAEARSPAVVEPGLPRRELRITRLHPEPPPTSDRRRKPLVPNAAQESQSID